MPPAVPDHPVQPQIPDWLTDEWKAVHEIEPALFPHAHLIASPHFYDVPKSRLVEPYAELCRLCGAGVSHVILVPWLVRGGADLVALNYVRELNNGLAKKVIVIATLDADSVWKERLPAGVRFIEFGKRFHDLTPFEQELLLSRLLLQMAPQAVHNINSDLAYRVIKKYGKALKSVSNLYASAFCCDLTPDGAKVGYPFWYISDCIDDLKAVLTDNRYLVDELIRIYAVNDSRFIVHYQPAPIPPKGGVEQRSSEGQVSKKETLNILWAGRLDRQKRPDLLIEIAKRCVQLPLVFYAHGAPVIDADTFSPQFAELKNIVYHGPFDGFASLPVQNYDLFLNTSQWDGLPNILLEAISCGLPVVTSDVGGISEIIRHKETGFLVSPFDDISAYVDILKTITRDHSVLDKLTDKAHKAVENQHSAKGFREKLVNIPGYVNGTMHH